MLEGLEISEVYLSYIKEASDVFRFDSFYYLKKFIHAENIIAKHKTEKLKNISKSILSFGAYSLNNYVEYQDYGIPFIRGVNLKNGMLDFGDMIFINEVAHKLLWKSEVHPNTILLSMSGTIGNIALAMPSFSYPMNSNQDIAKIRIKENVSTYYVYAFLLSRFGQNYLSREARGSVQQHVFLSQMENFVIPILNTDIQSEVDLLVKQSYTDEDSANNLYSQAEDLLLNSLGFKDWRPEKKSYNIKQLKESFLASGRLDAEHYQVKYDELESLIKSASYKSIAEIQQFNARGVQPDYVKGGEVSVVNSKHILEDGLDYDNFEHTTPVFLNTHNRAQIRYGDILIYTTGANIGRTQVYLIDEPAIASNHVNILRVQGVNPIYLALVLNSQIGRLQTEKMCTGSAQAELYPSDIEKFIVPILPEEKQQTIAGYVQKSVSLRQQAKQLLEDAKLKVETAIMGGGDNQIVTIYNKMIEQSTYYYRLAEWTLLEELYANKWTATSSVNYSVKPYSVCQTTGRLDSEYYQPKYDALFEKLSHYRCNTIREIASIKKSIEPGSDAYCNEGVPFVRVSDMTKYGISKTDIYLSRADYDVDELHPKKDTILLSKDGSVGIAYKVTEDMDCITSGALLHLSVSNENYLPDYVTLVLNSIIVRMQAERDSNGAIIQHWKPSEINQVVIPHLPMDTQRIIASKVQQSFALRSESKRLLEIAKQSVEMEINRIK